MQKASTFTRLIVLLAIVSLVAPIIVAQSTTRKIPTAPQAAMQNKVKGRKDVMRGTTQYDRWQTAIKSADRRASLLRAEKKGAR